MSPAAFAEIDLAALRHNLLRIRDLVPQARIMAVIKANAYGHGMVRVARALDLADAFAVARVDEGVRLREAGITQRIAVLQGFTRNEELDLHFRFDLEPVIHSEMQIELLERADRKGSIAVWLKVDTGMHRLGLPPERIEACRTRLLASARVRAPLPIMTHLANADIVEDDTTGRQLEVFGRVSATTIQRSIANSAGVLGWQSSHAEWIRPGLALYGVSPFPGRCGTDEGLRPVMTLKSGLIAVKTLNAGEPVGYGGDWVCPRATRMGIAAIGYGDGYPRSVTSGTPVLVAGRRAPLIGRVSMDMISVDLTELPDARVGDTVTLWGEGLPVEEIAGRAGTIPYVLLCNVTQRVRMVERS